MSRRRLRRYLGVYERKRQMQNVSSILLARYPYVFFQSLNDFTKGRGTLNMRPGFTDIYFKTSNPRLVSLLHGSVSEFYGMIYNDRSKPLSFENYNVCIFITHFMHAGTCICTHAMQLLEMGDRKFIVASYNKIIIYII